MKTINFWILQKLDVSISTIKLDLKEIKIFLMEHDLNLVFVSKQGVILRRKRGKNKNASA